MHGLNNPHIAITFLSARIAQLEQEIAQLTADLEAFMPIQGETMLRNTLESFEGQFAIAIEELAKQRELARGVALRRKTEDEALLDKAVELATTQQTVVLSRTMARLIWIALTRVCGEQSSSSTVYSVTVAGLGNLRLSMHPRGCVLSLHTGVSITIATKCGPVELDRIPGGWMASLYGEGYSPREVIHADTYAQLSAEIATQWM